MADQNLHFPLKYSVELGARVVAAGADEDGLTADDCKVLGVSEICNELRVASDFKKSFMSRYRAHRFLVDYNVSQDFLDEVFGGPRLERAMDARVRWFADQIVSPLKLPLPKRLEYAKQLFSTEEDAALAKPQIMEILERPWENLSIRIMASSILKYFSLDSNDYKVLTDIITNPKDNVLLKMELMNPIGHHFRIKALPFQKQRSERIFLRQDHKNVGE